MFQPPIPSPNSAFGALATQMVANVISNAIWGTTVYHFQAQHTEPENYDDRGRPDYLSPDPGLYGSGVQYVSNPNNPLKGIFCQAPRKPYQDTGGIYYQGQFELYLTVDLGKIFVLDGKYPKRQDAFEIGGRRYYAVAPATPCQMGDNVAAWKIDLNIERYPVS